MEEILQDSDHYLRLKTRQVMVASTQATENLSAPEHSDTAQVRFKNETPVVRGNFRVQASINIGLSLPPLTGR